MLKVQKFHSNIETGTHVPSLSLKAEVHLMKETTEKTDTLETYQQELHQLIDKMDDYQAELVLSFIKTLFGLSD